MSRVTRKSKAVIAGIVLAAAAVVGLTACTSDQARVNQNVTTEAGQFKVFRKVVVENNITDKYLVAITGFCDVEPSSGEVQVTCKTGPDTYKRDAVGLGDNDSWQYVQLAPLSVSKYHYEVVFKPANVLPTITPETSGK